MLSPTLPYLLHSSSLTPLSLHPSPNTQRMTPPPLGEKAIRATTHPIQYTLILSRGEIAEPCNANLPPLYYYHEVRGCEYQDTV